MNEQAEMGRPASQCGRCSDNAVGLGSSARCICGPNVPCEWCEQGVSGEKGGRPAENDAPVIRGDWEGLRHECRDPHCHVSGFVETLRLMRDGLDPDIRAALNEEGVPL